ncbi:MAG: DEAD/DEAH box helicase family protein [Anaerolineales bacterium]|nr:DEAD/DEAH box helicase family protein [Anaerolineales bacterium]
MKLALKEFQETTVTDLIKQLRLAKNEIALGGSPQAVILTSPTGSGKTVMLAALIEEILTGSDWLAPEPEAVFLWLSDQPELNEQSRHKLVAVSSRLRPLDFIIVDSSFDRETFASGKVYFLNTQKLGKDKNLVTTGDKRSFTIWQTIQNTAVSLPDKFYVIIDEAHRGMAQSAATGRHLAKIRAARAI